MPGPAIRTDIVEVFVFRLARIMHGGDAAMPHFLQLHRAAPPLAGTWQVVMGHIEAGETAWQAAERELREETGLTTGPGGGVLRAWQLELVNTFFLNDTDQIIMSPGFAVQVAHDVPIRLDESHNGARWVARDRTERAMFWPGQRKAVDHIVRDLLPDAVGVDAKRFPEPSLTAAHLRVGETPP